MTTKSRTDEELWGAVQDLDRDLLDPTTPTEVLDSAAKGMGLDPSALRAEGRALATALLDEKRRAWMRAARQNIESLRARARSATDFNAMDKQMLLVELERWRTHPTAGGEIRAAFRNRKPEESSEADLRSLLEEIERVAAMGSGEDDG
jgi:hypothetical protein